MQRNLLRYEADAYEICSQNCIFSFMKTEEIMPTGMHMKLYHSLGIAKRGKIVLFRLIWLYLFLAARFDQVHVKCSEAIHCA